MKRRGVLGFDLPWLVRDAANDVALPWQSVIDSLQEQVAMLDEHWTILAINRAWVKSAGRYGPAAFVPGVNYYSAIQEFAAAGLDIAGQVIKGMDEIAAGRRSTFRATYRYDDGPEAGRDFEICVSRVEADGRQFASIIRYDVTRLVEFRNLKKAFSSSVIASQAGERRRIGRDVHDSTMQLTAAIQMQIARLKRVWIGADRSVLDEMSQLIAQTQQAIRTIAHLAHPPLLKGQALSDATRALVEGFGRRTGLDVAFEIIGTPGFSLATDEVAYRAVQEALSNVHRHAHAGRARVVLAWRKSCLHVVITDDGVGIPEKCQEGVGLAGMRSRLSEVGGRLTIRASSAGTAVVASIPLTRDQLS